MAYTLEMCKKELKDLEAFISGEVEKALAQKDFKEIALRITGLKEWRHLHVKESIRLRLEGKLNYPIFRTYIEGISTIISKLWDKVKKAGEEAYKKVKFEYDTLQLEGLLAKEKK